MPGPRRLFTAPLLLAEAYKSVICGASKASLRSTAFARDHEDFNEMNDTERS